MLKLHTESVCIAVAGPEQVHFFFSLSLFFFFFFFNLIYENQRGEGFNPFLTEQTCAEFPSLYWQCWCAVVQYYYSYIIIVNSWEKRLPLVYVYNGCSHLK